MSTGFTRQRPIITARPPSMEASRRRIETTLAIERNCNAIDIDDNAIKRGKYPRRKLLAIVTLVFFFVYVITRSSQPSSSDTLERKCSIERLKYWSQALTEFDAGSGSNAVKFVGNGFIGVDANGQLKMKDPNTTLLDFETGFYPTIMIGVESTPLIDTTVLTDFKSGSLKTIKCFTIDGECACTISTIYTHRTRPNLFVQTIEVSNPTRSTVRITLERSNSPNWISSKIGEVSTFERKIGNDSHIVVCSDVPGKISVPQKREETLRFVCAVNSQDSRNIGELKTETLKIFSTARTIKDLDLEHMNGWEHLNRAFFRVATSKAPNTLNGDRINATRYILQSNIRALTIEKGSNPEIMKNLEVLARKSELCYTGHSNLFYPSRLWQEWDTPNNISMLAKSWMLTFEKRGCHNLIKTGAVGVTQAFVQSLSASSYHDSHLEVALDAHDLHREISFGGIPVHSAIGTVGAINVDIKIDDENRPYFIVTSTNQLYACDGGCLDSPVSLGKIPTKIPVKVTKPVTSLLYIATNRKHLEILKSAIHVSEVGSAPAHEDDVIELHRSGGASSGMPTMSAEQRRFELERKKQKLAEMRSQRQKAHEHRTQELLKAPLENGNAAQRQTLSSDQVEELLREVGIQSEPNLKQEEAKENHQDNFAQPQAPAAHHPRISSLMVDLEFSPVQTFTTDNKEQTIYSKGTQTDDERISVGEFSLGSQEFDYDDDMIMPMDHQFRGRTHSHDQESPLPISEEIAKLLPGYQAPKLSEKQQSVTEEKPPQVTILSEEERVRLTLDPDFLDSFQRSAKVIERALNEEIDVTINYTKDPYMKDVASDDLLHLAKVYYDETWTAKRLVTDMTFSENYPDLMAVSYGECDTPNKPPGVVVVWNTKSKRVTAEFIVYCQSEIRSVAFARFHAHLLLAGCESGQICVWDNRLTSRKLPINRSPLSTQAHTQPVSCLAVVGTRNAHNFVSISRDGKICSWNVDNLTQPVDGKELLTKEGKVAFATKMSFPVNEMQTFVVGTDSGEILLASRNGADPNVIKADDAYKGHSAPLTGIEFHRASGVVDFSHLFISSSNDWTIKLWSTKDPSLKFSFESHPDLVLDVAWSPVHPAVFASIDADGNLFVWNLNEDVEGPVARLRPGEGESAYMNKLVWSPDGKRVCVGDDDGRVLMYDVRESMYVLKSEEWNRFARVLSDMKESNEEAEKYN
ncbi:unnamed protein product [Caenorhabditis bovis]|uniref:Uncharacterized protein n=1 Tax=Caenorhabditis bovis TaxID=2654633 RepID=A0A8S1F0J3_9PELO|nr:unnamed protein product [Caenorhabditis bovis]